MAKTKISEFSATPANNTDIDSINISEGCPPSSINDAIRELMSQLKDFQTGAVGDSFNGPIGSSTASTGAFTTLSATGAITSTLATGTAPLVIASTTKVANLNVDLLDGADWAAPAALGSTTPAAGAFTTLSASSTVTLSGGTANGVAYLNGSKVVTSGSALTFDGTLLTVASSTPKIRLSDSGLANDFGIDFYFPSIASSYGQVTLNGSTGGMRFVAGKSGSSGYYQAFELNGSEQMRLTSTGLGIGTSSPASPLAVAGTASVNWAGAGSSTGTATIGTQGTGGSLLVQTPSVNASYASGFGVDGTYSDGKSVINLKALGTSSGGPYSADMAFFTSTNTTLSEKMRLDSSGNLGLGVTPSAWGSTWKAIQVGMGGSIFARTADQNRIGITANAFFDTAFKYIGTGQATFYDQDDGNHYWYNAPSGTAGNAITFTQVATIDASGNFLVGKTADVLANTGALLDNRGSFTFTRSGATVGYINRLASDGEALVFMRSTTDVGSIDVTTTATSYNTSSDYRLKNITGPVTNSGAYIDSLNPVEGTWKADGSTFVGLIAHEVQEASRTNVATGVKDGEEMQGMDYSNSELIANLIAEVKSLRQRVATLEAK